MSFVISRLGVFLGSVLRRPDFRDLDTPLGMAEENIEAWEPAQLTPTRPAFGAGSCAGEVKTSAESPSPQTVPSSALPEMDELAELIAEVLADHTCVYDDDAVIYECSEARYPYRTHLTFGMESEWRAHVAPLIAERIEKARTPAPFTFGDLAEAARVIAAYAHGRFHRCTTDEYRTLVALANRLADASEADPNP